ncbi:MAG: S8 family serine peptidase [Ardenticatenia bacterium]|nr:S8 family serine peptidase [Ardenticatenia bacterium]
MQHRFRHLSTLLALGLMAFVGGRSPAAARPVDGPAAQPQAATHRYIVVLQDPPLASYAGGLPGLAATSPQAVRRLDPARYQGVHVDVSTPEAKAYRAYLSEVQADMIQRLRYLAPEFTENDWQYQVTLNGFTARLTYASAEQARELPGVKLVYPAEELVPEMDGTKDLLGTVKAWEAAGGVAEAGLGARVGTMEAGNAVNHPFLRDEGMPAAPAGYPVAKYHLRDGTVTSFMTQTHLVNNKVLGFRVFSDALTPADINQLNAGLYVSAHGSHVAGTITGRWGKYEVLPGIEVEMAGVAPMASLFTYPVFGDTPEMLAAFEVMAAEDKIDAVNLSLGTTTWLMDRSESHPVALAMSGAADGGVLVVGSSGNAGGNGRTSLSGGWKYSEDLMVVGNTSSTGRTGVPVKVMETDVPDALKSLLASPVKPYTATMTGEMAFVPGGGCGPADNVTGKIAVVERFDSQAQPVGTCDFPSRAVNMKNSGAKAIFYLYYDRFGGAAATNVALPAMAMGLPGARALVEWLKSGETLTVEYGLQQQRDYAGVPDYLAPSSSRGPGLDWTIKPDISAPGTDILSSVLNDNNAADMIPPMIVTWPAYSGTSMAAPHVTGAAGLLRSIHPDWTVDELRSALISSSEPIVTTGSPDTRTPADVTQSGPGRLDLSDAHDPRVFMDPPKASFGVLKPGDKDMIDIAISSANGETSWWDVTVEPGGSSGKAVAVPSAKTVTVMKDKTATLSLSLDTAGADKAEHWGYVVLTQRAKAPAPPGIYLPALLKDSDLSGGGPSGLSRAAAPAQSTGPDVDDLRTLRIAYYAYVDDPAVRKDVLVVNWTYGNTPNHVEAYTAALDKLGLSYDVWWMGEPADRPAGSTGPVLRGAHPPYEEMFRHDLVILNSNESATSMQSALAGQFQYQNYLLGGGNMLIAGQGTPNFWRYLNRGARLGDTPANRAAYKETWPFTWAGPSQNVGCEMCWARYFAGFTPVYTATLSGRHLLPYPSAPDKPELEVKLAPHTGAEADSPFSQYSLDLSTGAMAKDGAKGNQYTFASGEVMGEYKGLTPNDPSTPELENVAAANLGDVDDAAWTVAPGGRGKTLNHWARPMWSYPVKTVVSGTEETRTMVVGTYIAGKHDPESMIAWNAMFWGFGLEGVGKNGDDTASRDQLLGDAYNFLAKNVAVQAQVSAGSDGRPQVRLNLGRTAADLRIVRADVDWGGGQIQRLDFGAGRRADRLSFAPTAGHGPTARITLYPEAGTAAPIYMEAALDR